MKKILAVSGGVDSMVLLDIFKDDPNILVAHFNHGTRQSADDDEEFVKRRCEDLSIDYTIGHSNLGPDVSEENARKARYDFLFKLRDDIQGRTDEEVKIFTAHHLDDLVESVFINLSRGTGWRGLTPFSSDVVRPFLSNDILLPESKADILTYAARNKITYREDPTNSSDKYMRNRIRDILKTLDPEKHYKLNQEIKSLFLSQKEIRKEVFEVLDSIVPDDGILQREWFNSLEDEVCFEILRFALSRKNISLTHPQMQDFLNAIRTYAPEKSFNLPKDKMIKIHKNYFTI